MHSIRIAAVVFHSPRNQTAANLERMDGWVAAAAREGAGIVCFPEMNITGYGVEADLRAGAEPLSGEIGERLGDLAGRHRTVILAGLAEKGEQGRVYASHVVATPGGELGVYRKLHIAPPEKTVFTAGQDVPVFDAAGVRFGIQLCYDAHFPELATRMALDGAEVIFVPHASPRRTPEEKRASWLRHLPARAFDNGVFIVACNQTGANGAGLAFPGLAMVLGPDGRLIAETAAASEGLLLADLDAARLDDLRRHPMRYFLPQRRPHLCGVH